ncbi:hypothetical protein ACFXPI_27960 [Streptomyces sp. NPDC059104]|uniref:hypothetical protein n=1 Tax=Streptomyces sp. NPDC059104 TaxID=3346729 RepID=UPI00368D1F68
MTSETLNGGAPARDTARRARVNQLTRAAQWFAGIEDDPYGLVLRAGDEDPHPYEERVRALGPLYHSTLLDTWVTADPAVARQVLGDPVFEGPGPAGATGGGDPLPYRSPALTPDRADAARLGDLTAFGGPLLRAGGPASVERRTEAAARTLLAGLGPRFDLAEDFARPLVGRVLAAELGLPEAVHGDFVRHLSGCRHALDGLLCPQTHAASVAGEAAERSLAALLAEALPEAPPGAGAGAEAEAGAGAGAEVGADADRADADRADVLRAALALAVGCAEPTAVLLSHAVGRLLAEPGGRLAPAARPEGAAAAIASTLRDAPPVRLRTRTAREAVTLAGHELPAGAHVTVLVAAVARDPRAAADGPPPSLPADPYPGPGAHLVGAVARAALRVLAATRPGLRAAGAAVVRPRSPVLRAPALWPVAADPAYGTEEETLPCAS